MNLRDHVSLPLKRRLGSWLTRPPISSIIRATTGGRVRRWGADLELPRPQVSDRVLAGVFVRGHESAEIRSVLRLGGPFSTIVDLGASSGVLGAIAVSRWPTAHAYIGLDGNAELAEVARANVRRNFNGTIELIHGALAYGASTAVFSTNANILRSSLGGVSGQSVPAFTLSDVLDRVRQDDTVLLLCDIEGGEWDILENEPLTLRRIDTLVAEVHERADQSLAAFIDRLAAAGLRTICRDGVVITATTRSTASTCAPEPT